MVIAAISPNDVVPALTAVSVFYLLLVVLFIWLIRSVEMKLIGLGLLTAVLSVCCAQLPGEAGASVQIGPGPAGALGRVVAGGDVGGILGRIAVLLILAGLVVILLSRWGYPASTVQREETSRANPV